MTKLSPFLASVARELEDTLAHHRDRLRLRLIRAYRLLLEAGEITEEQFNRVLELLDHLDTLSPAELQERLAAIFPNPPPVNTPPGGKEGRASSPDPSTPRATSGPPGTANGPDDQPSSR